MKLTETILRTLNLVAGDVPTLAIPDTEFIRATILPGDANPFYISSSGDNTLLSSSSPSGAGIALCSGAYPVDVDNGPIYLAAGSSNTTVSVLITVPIVVHDTGGEWDSGSE